MSENSPAEAEAAPRVTVAIPVYNSATTLARCIRSASSQTLRDIEILVADDASTDDSAAIAEALALDDRRIRVIRLHPNGGKPRAMNRMIAEARGEWVAVLDADDTYLLMFFVAGGRACVVGEALYRWTMPFGTVSRRWTGTGGGAWRYDYRPALVANQHFIGVMQQRGEAAAESMLHRRDRQYRAMIPYLDAQKQASEGHWLRCIATIAANPQTFPLLTGRIAGRVRRALRRSPPVPLARAHVNAGFFALTADAPQWAAWARRYEAALRRTGKLVPHDQFALNHALHVRGRDRVPVAMLDPSCNWICERGTPMWNDAKGAFCKPYPPYELISAIHLAGPAKEKRFQVRRTGGGVFTTYLVHGACPDQPADVWPGQALDMTVAAA